MKDAMIGIVCGVVAVVLTALLGPAPRLRPMALTPAASPQTREVATGEPVGLGELARPFLPTTRPDPVVAKLSREIPGLDARRMQLERVLDWWAGEAGVNLNVDWGALEAAGINKDAEVGTRLAPGPAATTLRAVLSQAGGGNIRLEHRVEDGIVWVSTLEALAQVSTTRVYNVRDIIADALAGSGSWTGPSPALTEYEAADALVMVIQELIDPISWRYAGGTTGGIRYFAGRLVVTQTPENHDAVLGLLGALRATR